MSWRPHLALASVALLMTLTAWAKHVPTDRAMAVAFDPDAPTDERIWAMHLAACRATEVDPRLGDDLARAFLASDDLRLREAALLVDLCRHADRPGGPGNTPPLQEKYAYGPLPDGWTPHRLRSYVFHRRKVGGSHVGGVFRMDMTECRWMIDAIQGRPLPETGVIEDHRNQRGSEAATYYPQGGKPR